MASLVSLPFLRWFFDLLAVVGGSLTATMLFIRRRKSKHNSVMPFDGNQRDFDPEIVSQPKMYTHVFVNPPEKEELDVDRFVSYYVR